MVYVITDIFLKVAFNTNGEHIILIPDIVESGLTQQKYLAIMLYVIPDTLLKVVLHSKKKKILATML